MVLEVRNLSKHFGGVGAINDLSFNVQKGEVLGIIGPNGSGKTTLFNVITGALRPTMGQITYNGNDITGLSPHVIARRGIVRTFQTTTVFSGLTLLENVVIGQLKNRDRGVLHALFGKREDENNLLSKAEEILEFVGLIDDARKLAKNVTQERQKRLSIALALGGDPELMLLDEPSGGVNLVEIERLVDLIQRINSLGITICLIEHKMKMIMNLSKRIIALSFGVKIAQGKPDEVCKDRRVIEAYLGEENVA